MGVEVRVTLYATGEEHARRGARAAYAAVAAVDDRLSDYRRSSEIRRLERMPAGTWHPVSPGLARTLGRARAVAEWSDGVFDPTVGPLTRLWRAARAAGSLPDSAAVREAEARVGWRRFTVDTTMHRVRLEAPGVQFDLGGIGKGAALDAAARALDSLNLGAYLIQAGGDLVAGDPPPGTIGWTVALREITGVDELPPIARSALAVSGDGGQYIDVDGRRHSHTVDPRSGWATTHGISAVVIAADATLADGVATVVAVLGRVPRPLPPGVSARAVTDRP